MEPGRPVSSEDLWGVPQQRQDEHLTRSRLGFGTSPGSTSPPPLPPPLRPRPPLDPPARNNRAAVAGAALSVVPLLGMILSILGLSRASALGGAGRSLAAVGLVLSVACTGGEAYAAILLGESSSSADPACVAASTEIQVMQSQLTEVVGSIPTSSRQNVVDDLTSIDKSLVRDQQLATHADVRSALRSTVGDLDGLTSTVIEIEAGNDSAYAATVPELARLHADGQRLGAACGYQT
jgi:hypothetical protein